MQEAESQEAKTFRKKGKLAAQSIDLLESRVAADDGERIFQLPRLQRPHTKTAPKSATQPVLRQKGSQKRQLTNNSSVVPNGEPFAYDSSAGEHMGPTNTMRCMKFRVVFVSVLCFSVVWLGTVSGLFAQENSGSLSGTALDQSGAVLHGVAVTVMNKVTNRVVSSVTGPDGAYVVAQLGPGHYSVKFELTNFAPLNFPDIEILVGQFLKLDAKMQVGGGETTIQVTDVVPLIDTRDVLVAHNITQDELDRIPKTRTFQGVALTSPGVNQGDIEGGLQVNGASGAENSYIVDGVVTTSPIEGQSRQNTIFEYLQEVQVKTGGIDAEYGGALGGVVSAVTKSGGNSFHGEIHYYYSGSGLSAGPIPRLQLSPVDNQTVFHVQDAKKTDHRNEFGGSVGGPIVKDKLFFFGLFSPQVVHRSNNYLFSNGLEPGTLSKTQINYQGFGKVTYESKKWEANFGILTTPTRDKGKQPAYNGTGTNFIVSPQASYRFNPGTGFAQDQYNLNANVSYLLSPTRLFSLRGGYFSDNYVDTGIPLTTSYTYIKSSVGAANIPANLQGPINTSNVPRTIITFFDKTRSSFGQLDYSQMFSRAGSHSLKGGIGIRRTANDVNKMYPGGYTYIYWNSSVKGSDGVSDTGTYGYYRVDDYGTKGKVGANIVSLYFQDAWSIAQRLTLSLGIRTENEKIPTFRSDIQKYAFQFGFGDKISPRLGAAYDLLGDGRIKLFGSWGRYFDWTKYAIARGSFGGDFWHIYYRSLDTLAIDTLNINNLPGRDLWRSSTGFRDQRLTSISNTDPNIKPMFQDDMSFGVDYELNPRTIVGLNYIHNNLQRTIEDFSVLIDGNNVYRIGNPGEGTSAIYPASYPLASQSFPMPKPKRQYDALELTFNRRFAQRWFLNANYTWSRLYGNYTGLSNSDEIDTPTTGVSQGTAQQQAGSIVRPGINTSIAWDTDTLLWDSRGHLNLLGRLPTDRPHVLKVYGGYALPFGSHIGAFFYGGSGTPVSTYVNSLNLEPLLVNGRGDMGRTPFLSHTDLLFSHEIKRGENQRLRFELNVLNLFNQKTPTHIFNFLNKGAPGGGSTISDDAIDMSTVNLSQGYDYNALILATKDGKNAYDPRYGQPDLWNTGLQGQFGIKFLF